MATFGFYGLNYWETVEDTCLHAAMRLTSIEFSFDPCNIYRDGPRGVGYPADAHSVGDSHPSRFKLHLDILAIFLSSYNDMTVLSLMNNLMSQ